MKSPSGGTEFFHADGRTDMTKQIVTFRNFAKALKIDPGRGISTCNEWCYISIFLFDIFSVRPFAGTVLSKLFIVKLNLSMKFPF